MHLSLWLATIFLFLYLQILKTSSLTKWRRRLFNRELNQLCMYHYTHTEHPYIKALPFIRDLRCMFTLWYTFKIINGVRVVYIARNWFNWYSNQALVAERLGRIDKVFLFKYLQIKAKISDVRHILIAITRCYKLNCSAQASVCT